MGRAALAIASVHSRAARRLTSPSIDLDKSLKYIKPPSYTKKSRPSILEIHHGAGVTKKTKTHRKSVLSAKARRRHEKGLDHAVAVLERTEKKIKKSKVKAKVSQERSINWEDVNKQMNTQKAKRGATLTLETSTPMESDKSINLEQSTKIKPNDQGLEDNLEDSITERISSLIILPLSGKEVNGEDGEEEIL
ncbi:hypothetical protein OnM2_086009 [Erysiphe neolycopersici]|uniref:Ribosome biogenesis protein Alb1 n=1 Tax=Erysiphe neolycopersici TaxID=212602 RepID=A0A420HED7_9PEZI|nr:hypothetical protein OnM2_086009 [Erysiphe neolycopersici]